MSLLIREGTPTLSSFLFLGEFLHKGECRMSKRLTKENSLGVKRPESLKYWSDENNTTPYDHFPRETTKVWWKCPDGIHKDFLRTCDGSYQKNYECPICNKKKQSESYIERLNETFEDYCIKNNLLKLLDLWDFELNELPPNQVASHSSRQKYYFKCPRNIHGSHLINLNNLCRDLKVAKKIDVCPACRSIGQYIIDEYGQEYLDNIWSDKNNENYFDISRGSTIKKIWLKCLNDKSHPDYDLTPGNFMKTHNCPYCSGKRSLNNFIKDKKYNGKFVFPSSKEKQKIRNSKEYHMWRERAKQYDNYKCQCCGASDVRLNVHHIYNFEDFEDLRFDDSNSITLCDDHHNFCITGSFHDEYGSRNNTPQQLEEFINKKRKQLGIIVPFNIENYIGTKNTIKFNNWINFINSDPEYEEPLDKEE